MIGTIPMLIEIIKNDPDTDRAKAVREENNIDPADAPTLDELP
jgi:hypothetical protein